MPFYWDDFLEKYNIEGVTRSFVLEFFYWFIMQQKGDNEERKLAESKVKEFESILEVTNHD